MTRGNLSAWALDHRSIVVYLMVAFVIVGTSAYLKLGRNEDPTFTIKTMVVQAQWPGATMEDTLLQVTERIERKLQETPHLDYIKSYTRAGQATVFVYLKGSTGPKEVSDTWYQVRKKIRDIQVTFPQGVIGPECDDEFGDTYGIVYGFTAEMSAPGCFRCRTWPRSTSSVPSRRPSTSSSLPRNWPDMASTPRR